MFFQVLSLLLPLQVTSALSITRRSPPSFIYSGDAPYGVSTANLSSILTCPNGYPTSDSKPVLLVHGTGSTGEETWAKSYVPALTANGYLPCYVTLPGRSAGDIQYTSAYVAYNLHYLSYLASGTPVRAIGHSQGNINVQWAFRFFPSTRKVVSSYFGLSPDFGPGTTTFRVLCDVVGGMATGGCDPAQWQQATDSNFYAALNYKGHQAYVPETTTWTETDEIVIPPEPNAQLPGATVISVQSICPLQLPEHFSMLVNPVAFALALDAFSHGGVADPSRIPSSICDEITAPNMNGSIPALVQNIVNDVLLGNVLTSKVPEEPPVLAYAQIQNQ